MGIGAVSRRPPLLLRRRPVHRQAARERLDRRQQTLLQAHHEQPGGGASPARCAPVALLARLAVFVEQARQHQLGRVVGQARDLDAVDHSPREPVLKLADVLLEPAHHHVVELPPAPHPDAAGEAVGVEQLEQGREAVRVAVVRRG